MSWRVTITYGDKSVVRVKLKGTRDDHAKMRTKADQMAARVHRNGGHVRLEYVEDGDGEAGGVR